MAHLEIALFSPFLFLTPHPMTIQSSRHRRAVGHDHSQPRGLICYCVMTGLKCESIFKISEGRPNPADYLKNGEVTMLMITSSGDEPDLRDGKDLRRLALTLQVGP